MSVNVYKNDFGYFSVISDDDVVTELENNFKQTNRYYIVERSTIQPIGETLLNTLPLNDMPITICINDPNYNTNVYTLFKTFFPRSNLKNVDDATSEAYDRFFALDENHSIFTNYSYRTYSGTDYPRYLEVGGGLKYKDDVVTFTDGDIGAPFGNFTISTLSTTASQDYIHICFFICNSDFSKYYFGTVSFINNYGSIRGTFYYYTDNRLTNDFVQKFFTDLIPTDFDPYSQGGTSGEGGGTGDFDGTSDDISIPELPTLSATSTNFITLFNPSLGELQNLANYMWSDLFDLDTFKKIFADPMDCILGLSIVPVAVPSGGSKAVTVGNISTGVTMQVASAQYVSVDCGTLNVNEYWGAYLDYDPYTKAEIYLPYIGTHPIAVDDIMGKAVHVVYHVDILSGACTAYVQCGGSVLYSFIGQCSASIPITGNDWTNVINGVLSIAGSIGSMVATGGMSAPLTALQAPVTTAKVGGALATGSSLASTAINSMKPSVEKSGSMSGVGGMLAVQTPYIILTRPRQARPKQQNTYTGYPSFITSKLSKLTGYTEIEVIHMDGLSCTDSESVEIESLLKSGVIF